VRRARAADAAPALLYPARYELPDTFLAAALAELTDEALAAALGCAPAVVWQLRLARHPRPRDWDADVARLAGAVSCQPLRLTELLRRLPSVSDP
jgi:hypothetical protein